MKNSLKLGLSVEKKEAVGAPEVDVPEVDVPEVDVPVVDAPEVDAPEVDAPEPDAPAVAPDTPGDLGNTDRKDAVEVSAALAVKVGRVAVAVKV